MAALDKPFLRLHFVPLFRVCPLLYYILPCPSHSSCPAMSALSPPRPPQEGLWDDISTEFSSLTTASLSMLLPCLPLHHFLLFFCFSSVFSSLPHALPFFLSATLETGFHPVSQAAVELTYMGSDWPGTCGNPPCMSSGVLRATKSENDICILN